MKFKFKENNLSSSSRTKKMSSTSMTMSFSGKSIFIICIQAFLIINYVSSKEILNNHFMDNEIDQNDVNLQYQLNQQQHENHSTELNGGKLIGEKVLRKIDSPFVLRTDLEIDNGAKLIIEPGVTINFAPTVGITVHGVIKAIGNAENKIHLTSLENSGYDDQLLPLPQELGARLVDGPTPLEGRLQLYHKGTFRSVCTNSRNWTIQDYETVCRQMGFQGGTFWNWVERVWNNQPRLLLEEPKCRGQESSIFDCAWHSRQLGSGVCDYHSDIGVQCAARHEPALAHWRGLSFDNAPTKRFLSTDNTIYSIESESELKHVNVIRAGSGRNRQTSAAIEVIGMPPKMSDVTIDHSAYTGINVTKPEAAFSLNRITVRRSKGFGIFVNSSSGLANLEDCNISENGADGVRYIGHDLRSDERKDRANIHDFCTLPTTAGQTYPIAISLQQSLYAASPKECSKYFFTRPDYVLTINFVYFQMKTNETAQLDIFDGATPNDRLLATWLIRNSTRVQSVTSTTDKMFVRFKANARSELLGYLKFTTGPHKTYDLNVTNSEISDNYGRGIALDNLRSQMYLSGSSVLNNGHVSGLHVTSGAGDVNVTNSKISFNNGGGVNITFYGGNTNISRSSVSSNRGNGLSVWLNETKDMDRIEFLPQNYTTTVEYSKFMGNLEMGVRHGNFCGNIWINITANYFNNSNIDDLHIESCWFEQLNDEKMFLQIGHNKIENSQRNGIVLNPILNMIGKIEYNHFRYGKYGAIFVRNPSWEEFRNLPVHLTIQNNEFYKNQGRFVCALGLTPYSDRETQWILFTKNFVIENKISEPFGSLDSKQEGLHGAGRLNPRSKISAALVVSSANVDIFRNIISNRESLYEIGSQLSDQSQTINATYNWLGDTSEEKIYNRLFHRKDRYDLAKIEYLPYLLHNSNPSTSTIIAHPTFVPRFFTEGSEFIGGEVDGLEKITAGSYTVNRDINVRPGGKLIINPGVTLNFEPSVGIMIAGKLEARGRRPDDILFTLKRETIMTNDNETVDIELIDDTMHVVDIETETVIDVNETPNIPIRLLGGANNHEGRLQVYLDGRWGTVCDYQWSIINAALACHQLGFTLNPMDWRLQRSEIPGSGTTEDVILSNVRCSQFDTDLTKCPAERFSRGEFENSCTHENDVGLRCYEGAWAGLRFSPLAERADLQYLTIEKAGLFDYTTNSFKPAVQMDFARHNFENIRVVENLHDGLSVIYSDVFGGKSINNIRHSEFSKNWGNGISLKQLGLLVYGSEIKENYGSGISHNPVLSQNEQRELAGWFRLTPDFNSFDSKYEPFILPVTDSKNIDLDQWQSKHIVTERYYGEEIERKITIKCPPGYVIGIQLLNPIENRSTETIRIQDSQLEFSRSDIWDVKRDLSVFPVTSSSYGVQLYYTSGRKALGGAVLYLSTIQAPEQNIKNRIVRGPVPTLHVRSTKIQRNSRGLSATYYNRYFGEKNELYLRKANESIKLVNTEISYNRDEAVLVAAPFWDVHVSNLSEITIHINNSMILKNGQGIRQFSKDLRSSNNLFHYVLQDTTVENNEKGGMDVSLPYVWQYNENFTHSIFLNNSTWRGNKNFGFIVRGHYAMVNISWSMFVNNFCQDGLIALHGMEKKIKIDNNRMEGNNGKYILEFKADSLSEILGEVPAVVTMNSIENNHYDSTLTQKTSSYQQMMRMRRVKIYKDDPTSVIRFGGIQKADIYRNLFNRNEMDYDLIAGIRSARLKNFLYASENWWGTNDLNTISSRIFDFDDWNNHAEVVYQPFLIENALDASSSVLFDKINEFSSENFGGRVFNDITINRRDRPYIIKSDITVMPKATLTINRGVIMEFAPNVGILVLGTLKAIGAQDSEIILRPATRNISQQYNRIERSVENMIPYDTIRLCTEKNCTSSENEVDFKNEGFLEYFNHTTLQWVPICDSRFTERNAEVVCRELGYDPINIYYSHDRRIEFHTNSLTRIWSWVEPMECKGNEMRLELCPERLNGQLYGRRHECHWNDKFVFVSCNGTPNNKLYWGGVRFANSEFERNLYENSNLHDIHTPNFNQQQHDSELRYVRIEGTGMLHNEKSPAIEAIYKTPIISSVTINDSVHHGINLIAPADTVHLKLVKVDNVLGNGINIISLTGEGRESDESSFVPLKSLDLPYHLFSMIDICDTMKEITIEERIILYYKYDNNPVNCVKIFKTAYLVKPIGFRLLQANLFNHSKEYGRTDAIHLYDGDIYNISSIFIDKIEAESSNENKFFKTDGHTLSVRLIASGAPAHHGFFAEVVTVPISTIGFNRDAQHNVSYSEVSNAKSGAFLYAAAGEVTPILTLEMNRFENNCIQLYGNFSTCDYALNVDVQNMQSFHFMNNLVRGNQGGLRIRADSRGSATSLRGYVHHNLFTNNRNRAALQVEGRQSSPYQQITIYNNYITQNYAGYDDVIRLRQVVSNFTHNYIHSNFGGRTMEVSGFDKVRLNIYQTTSFNGFYENYATDWRGRSTIVAGTAGQKYVNNIFYNPNNDYEMITVNRSLVDFQYWNSTVEFWKTKIDARYNYWSYNETISVLSRIRDKSDDPLLLEVEAQPFHMNNETILDEKCPPGWVLVHETCYMYVGALMTFHEARDFCRSDNASLPFVRSEGSVLYQFTQNQMRHLKYIQKIWVQDFNYIDRCTTFSYNNIEVEECDKKYGFLCEIDPKVVIDPLSWRADIFAISIISAFIIVFILLTLIALCWYAKSKHRHIQRLERRNSIRQSLRSLNNIDPQGSLRRRNFHMSSSTNTLTKATVSDYKKMHSNGSVDSMDKSALSSDVSFDIMDKNHDDKLDYDHHLQHQSNEMNYNDIVGDKYREFFDKKNSKSISITPMAKTATVGSTRSGGKPTKSYNMPVEYNPSGFELSYRNEGFRDNSSFSGTRNNSISTNLTEDTPIIHQIDIDDMSTSDYYGNASTLPLTTKNDNLSFLSELKQRLPEYNSGTKQTSFLPTHINGQNKPSAKIKPTTASPSQSEFDRQIDQLHVTPIPEDNYPLDNIEIRTNQFNRNNTPQQQQLFDLRRPDSYYTAVRSSRAPQMMTSLPSNNINNDKINDKNTSNNNDSNNVVTKRPKTVYKAAADDNRPSYTRSKSEALLETNFDEIEAQYGINNSLQQENRSYSQPLETAM